MLSLHKLWHIFCNHIQTFFDWCRPLPYIPTCIKPQTLTGYNTFVKPKYTYEAGLSALLQNQEMGAWLS